MSRHGLLLPSVLIHLRGMRAASWLGWLFSGQEFESALSLCEYFGCLIFSQPVPVRETLSTQIVGSYLRR